MDSMEKYSWFEREFRKDIPDSSVDYSAVEARLFARISDAEELGVLSILKLDEMLSMGKMEQIQTELFSRVSQFVEYDEPVNECINSDQNLLQTQWERLESKLEKRLNDIRQMPEWEQILMAPEKEPTPGKWELIEESLNREIEKVEKLEKWEQVAKEEIVAEPGALEKAENLLYQRLSSKQELENWENVIRCDEVIAYRRWEKIEEELFQKLQSDNLTLKTSRQPFWFIVEHFFSTFKTSGVLSAVLLLAVAGFIGFNYKSTRDHTVPTLVYELHGSAVNSLKLSAQEENTFSSTPGGAVTLVNAHGVVELQNESSVHLAKLSKKGVHYNVAFKESETGGMARGRISFLVNPKRPNEEFKVYTPDYQITVKGTYFRVEPDLAGKVSTRVLEGAVKISSRNFGDTVLLAGQSILYDPSTNQYRIHNGGPVVQRREIEQYPAVEELLDYRTIYISANVPDAEVRIDDKYYGTAPLGLLQPSGIHRIQITKRGYVKVDTTINLSGDSIVNRIEVTLSEIKKPSIVNPEPVIEVKESEVKDGPVQRKGSVVSPDQVARMMMGADNDFEQEKITTQNYLKAQKAERAGNWRSAIKLFQQVFDDQSASRLRREDALFSIGKLKAENEKNPFEAKEVFLTYLALFPSGSFAGESWLRLAELEFRTNPENAIQYYLKYFEMFPRHPRIPELQNRVGVIYLQQKRYDDAIAMFRQALSNQMAPRDEERRNVILNLHKALQEKGDIKSAEAVYKQYLAEADKEK